MSELTPRQSEVLVFIQAFCAGHGHPPTRADIMQRFGFRSPTAAEDHLRALARKGVIELVPGAARGIRLLEAANEEAGLPLLGRVAAGSPLLAIENIETRYMLDPRLFTPRADYLLRVRGQSMRDAGILDGDLLAVHKTREAHSGQIVVARIGEEVTVKRLQRLGARVRLLPANPQFAPIELDLRRQELAIEGLAVGVIRPQLGALP
ncbi:MAG: repressor LexA [Gammaproteobacteria bacterium]|nr:repressor LexA [Gammaproteobacteria bacterium]